jgi:signal transduction histidine kinase
VPFPPPPSARARVADAAIALALLVVCGAPYVVAIGVPSGIVATSEEALASVLVTAGLTLPLVWRRSHPLPSAVAVAVVCLAQLVVGTDLVVAQVAALVVLADVAAAPHRRISIATLALGIAGVALAALRYAWYPDAGSASLPSVVVVLVVGWVAVVAAWGVGDTVGRRRAERTRAAAHVARLEAERKSDLAQAVAHERARIAREMHDIIGHSLSIVIRQADGALYAAPAAHERVVPALEAIAETARTSLADLRRVLGVLRDTDGDAGSIAPMPGLDDIPALVDSARQGGLSVELDSRLGLGPRPSPGAQLVLYRVVQEALTNVRRHAGPRASAVVSLVSDQHATHVTVSDDGSGLGNDSHASGHGVVGMRERVALYDGDLDVLPGEPRGVTVRARLPHATAGEE